MESLGSVDDLELRKVRQFHDLRQKLKTGCDNSLRCDDCGEDADDKSIDQCAWRASLVNGIRVCLRMDADVCSLSNVCQKETREAETEPAESDGPRAESTQVGEESFHTSEGK